MKKKENLANKILLLHEKAALLDMNKLRMTGFECLDVFVIRCAKHTRRLRPAINDNSFVSELFLTDEFPNRSVRLISLSVIHITLQTYK
jgi:hypothetical protein